MQSHFWPFAERIDNSARRFPRWRALGSFLPAFLAFALFQNSAQAASSVKLVWVPNPESDIAGYRIYYGTVSRTYTGMVNAGNATNCVVPGLIEGKTYYFAATAYNTAGLESDFSNEVVHTSLYPTITLTAPANGTTSLAPATFNLAAQVVTNGHAILKVSFHNGAALLGEDLAPPYAFPWSNVPAGSYNLTARLHYDAGSSLASATALVTVTNPPPLITLTAPANGTTSLAPATFNLAAQVVTNGHAILKVSFHNGATLLGEDLAPPYAFPWSNVPAGSYNLTARLHYDAGSSLASATALVTVTNPPPLITLTAPANGTTSLAPAAFNLAAQVVTNGHAILKVSFHNGATLLGEDLAPPYAFPWSNVPAGSYNLTARLHYDAGSVLASAPANVIVAGLPAPWQTVDIGGGQLAGSAGAIDGVFTVKGAGPLGGTSDRFRFVFQSLSGDGEIKVALRSLATSGTNDWAGVMIRESLNGDSRYSFMGLSQSGSISSKSRRSTGGTASSTASGTAAMPNAWFRLVRTGNTISDYKSMDGVNWILMNSRIVTMATNIHVGLAVASASTNSLATATFNQVTVVP